MKITKNKLKQLIKEELSAHDLEEKQEATSRVEISKVPGGSLDDLAREYGHKNAVELIRATVEAVERIGRRLQMD